MDEQNLPNSEPALPGSDNSNFSNDQEGNDPNELEQKPIYPTPEDLSKDEITEDIAPDSAADIALKYAGFWIRLAAFIIDGIILTIVFVIINYLFFQEDIATAANPNTTAFPIGSPMITSLIISWLYFSVLTAWLGGTFGKKLVHLKVINLATQDKITIWKSLLREIVGKAVSSLVLMIGFIWIAFDSKKQGWHDKIAHTIVIKE